MRGAGVRAGRREVARAENEGEADATSGRQRSENSAEPGPERPATQWQERKRKAGLLLSRRTVTYRCALLAVAFVLVACTPSDPPGTLDSAVAAAAAFLDQTVSELFPTHRYTVDVWPRYGANCKRWDGTDDRSRNSVRHWYFVELQPGDQPIEMALAVVVYWEGLGFEVSYEEDDFGAGGSIYTADGHRFGFLAFNHLADEDDSLLLDSTTACYRRT